MVGNNAHGDIYFFIFAIFCTTHTTNFGNDRRENVGVVVRLYSLYSHTQTFEAHTGINYLSRKSFERAVGFAVVLHKYIVPNLNHLWVTSVYECQAVNLGAFVVVTDVDMYFGARATRSCIAHFPEIVFFVSVDNAARRQELFPNFSRFVVALQTFGCVTFENGYIKAVCVQFQYINQVFPCPFDSFFFEIIAKRPVTQHFEHGVMVRIVTNLFQIVVFSAYTKTFL